MLPAARTSALTRSNFACRRTAASRSSLTAIFEWKEEVVNVVEGKALLSGERDHQQDDEDEDEDEDGPELFAFPLAVEMETTTTHNG